MFVSCKKTHLIPRIGEFTHQSNGYIDVGDNWRLVTLCRLQFSSFNDKISTCVASLVTSFECWYQTLMLKDKGY